MKRFLLATFFLIPISGCTFDRFVSILFSQKDFIYLECSRPQENGSKWTIKLDIDLKSKTIDFYSQVDNFSKAKHYPSDEVEITSRYINFWKPGVSDNRINRSTGNYISTPLFVKNANIQYSCKKTIKSNNLF